ncbi:protease PrtS [Podospora fimiseda]|uniref:Protease PrtS n=1 Tax=Podospora fimiseda TaxID=252190 RepID=A0AAN7BFL1_9PEZI|nr:protease PrtS [Podospora fimiseda]
MHSPVCSAVPPYLLRAIAESEVNPQHVRDTGTKALAHHEHLSLARFTFLSALADNRPLIDPRVSASPRHSIVPEHLLQAIADSAGNPDEERARVQRHAQHARELAVRSLLRRTGDDQTPRGVTGTGLVIDCVVYDAKNSEVEMDLPGTLVRAEKEDKAADKAANQVFDNIASVLKFYSDQFQWQSIDNANMKVVSTIHFGDRYENAYWDPMRRQMVFGDGGTFLYNFTGAIDVIGHELTHAVTEFTSPLDYWGQSGALNEHVSDVFGIMVKHYVGKIKADEDDWLIGEACLIQGAKGVALRSMKAPGTAYDDPRFGKDPQPGQSLARPRPRS